MGKNGNVVMVVVEEKTKEMWCWWTKNDRNVVGKQEKCGGGVWWEKQLTTPEIS